MESLQEYELDSIAEDVNISRAQVERTVELLDQGNTIPFITRYRKDQTGGLDEEALRAVKARASQARALMDRKSTILKSISAQGKLTDALRQQILDAPSSKALEDQYLPFKPKKQTLATQARERGLTPLANDVINGNGDAVELATQASQFVCKEKGLPSVDEVMAGVRHLIAEQLSEDLELRQQLRTYVWSQGQLASCQIEVHQPSSTTPLLNDQLEQEPEPLRSESDTGEKMPPDDSARAKRQSKPKTKKPIQDPFESYFDFREPLSKIPPHRILAINRGERARTLRVRVDIDCDRALEIARPIVIKAEHPHASLLENCLRDSLSRLILPALEREVRRELTDSAEEHAISVFARNLKHLLLQRPFRGRHILSIDPGFKSGCQIAVLDAFGNVEAQDEIYIVGRDDRQQAGRERIVALIRKHGVEVVAIGNGTGCRQTEKMIAEIIASDFTDGNLAYVIVNEAGASVYSTSTVGREELGEFDVKIRSAISIGRRLLDPLSELVKISPANIGVGLYQHDVKAKHLKESLDEVVASCVNYVGVNVNSASPSLLRYVSGLNQLTARRICEYRQTHGPLENRDQLREIPGIGETTFVQAAGFLKIEGGSEPLDATWIHPESYELARTILARTGSSELADHSPLDKPVHAKLNSLQNSVDKAEPSDGLELDIDQLSQELNTGQRLLSDIVHDLRCPGRDPREDLPAPLFRQGIVKFEDLQAGMELSGRVLNVVDFGVFVDIGLGDSGLVHISKLSDQFVSDPHDIASVGDLMHVWVLDVDKVRRRVSLTAIPEADKVKREPRKQRTAKTGSSSGPPKGRPARQDNRPNDSSTSRSRAKTKRADKPHSVAAKRPAKPITKAMVEGKKPMRSFSDLKQFYEIKTDEDADK